MSLQLRRAKSVVRLVVLAGVVLSPGRLPAQQVVPNEINSSVPEPSVLLEEAPGSLPQGAVRNPFRAASQSRTQTSDPLVDLVIEARSASQRRLLSAEQHTPWQIMHGLLGLRQDFQIKLRGKPVSGLEWVASGPSFEGEAWFQKTEYGGRAHPFSRPWAFEGHPNQFLAILSMSGLELDHEFMTADGPISIRDMLQHARMTVNNREEITWTLWSLSRYLPPAAAWRNAAGENWSIERLVQIQTASRVNGTACGGTHGLFALAHARNVYQRTGQPLRGVWLEADQKIRKHIQLIRMQQNSNGMFSSAFFRGREYNPDFNKRMASAGHLLEFLMMSLSQEELQQQWVRRGIEAVCRDLLYNRKAYVKCSPLYHAVNGLSIYLDRVQPQAPPVQVARPDVPTRSISDGKEVKTAETVPPVPSSSAVMADSGAESRLQEVTDSAAPRAIPVPETPQDDAVAEPLLTPAPVTAPKVVAESMSQQAVGAADDTQAKDSAASAEETGVEKKAEANAPVASAETASKPLATRLLPPIADGTKPVRPEGETSPSSTSDGSGEAVGSDMKPVEADAEDSEDEGPAAADKQAGGEPTDSEKRQSAGEEEGTGETVEIVPPPVKAEDLPPETPGWKPTAPERRKKSEPVVEEK